MRTAPSHAVRRPPRAPARLEPSTSHRLATQLPPVGSAFRSRPSCSSHACVLTHAAPTQPITPSRGAESCGKRPDDLHVDDTLSELGDWRKEERVRHAEQLKDALAFVSDAADEDSLDQLTAAIEKRRDALSAKHEL